METSSQPSVASLLVSNLFLVHVTDVHPLAAIEVQAVQVPPGTTAQPSSHPSEGSLLVSN